MMLLLLQSRILTSMATSSSSGSLTGRACIFLCILVSLFRVEAFVITEAAKHCVLLAAYFENPRPVLSSFRPLLNPRCCAKPHTFLHAGDSESNALEKELQQKQSVGNVEGCISRPVA